MLRQGDSSPKQPPAPATVETRMAPEVATQPSLARTPALITPIMGQKGESFAERLKNVHALGHNLSREEISRLYAFLKVPPHPEEKRRKGEHVLKNDILNKLRRQASAPEGFTGNLIELYRDTGQDSVMRDYAIQHLVSWYRDGAGDAAESKEKIRGVLQEALNERSSIAGTALAGLHRLSRVGSEFDPDQIADAALRIAMEPTADEAARVTAIQVCAERGLRAALPVIEELARDSANLSLRISAIAALGRLSDARQIEFLQELAAGAHEPLKPAALAALKDLRNRDTIHFSNLP